MAQITIKLPSGTPPNVIYEVEHCPALNAGGFFLLKGVQSLTVAVPGRPGVVARYNLTPNEASEFVQVYLMEKFDFPLEIN